MVEVGKGARIRLMSALLETCFPNLGRTDYAVTSPRDKSYNCIAWAAGVTDAWWWPDPDNIGYWPPGVPRESSVAAFVEAFETLGYEKCENAQLDRQLEKIVIFERDGRPTHAARQLSGGRWTSKCGKLEDISHELNAFDGSDYGNTQVVMARRRV